MLLATAVASAAGAQKPPVLFGVVTNLNGVRLGGVELTVANTSLHAVTNDSGEYMFDQPPTGRVVVSAKRLGFKHQEKGFKLDLGATRKVNFELEAIPELLDSVLILGQGGTNRMAEFWARRAFGLGAFLTRSDIEHRASYRSSDLLRAIPGVRITSDNGIDRPVIQMGRAGIMGAVRRGNTGLAANCVVNYYVDGNWMPSNSFHIDDLSPTAIEAIEVYRGPAEIPAKFKQRETACGLLVIWTREPPPRDRSDTTGVAGPRGV